jgi:succinate dehydrogenase/fumarate reductase-like Fe-S protein
MTEVRQGQIVKKTAQLRIWRGLGGEAGHYENFDVEFEEGDSVLDGLVRLRYTSASDLAFQFSCFNANVCKECIMTIDGIATYACTAKLKTGVTQLDPAPGQPVLRDLLYDARECDDRGMTLRHNIQSISPHGRVFRQLPFGDKAMADHGEVEYASATGNDYAAHEDTYRGFVTLVKVSLAVIVVLLILMAYFLT